YHPEGAERLAAPLGTKADEDHVPALMLHIERRGMALDVLLAQEVAGQSWGAAAGVFRQGGSLEAVESREDRTVVHEDLGPLGHAGHHRMSRIGSDLEDRAAGK